MRKPPASRLTRARARRQVLGLALAMQACVRAVGGPRGVQLRVGVAMGAVVAGVMGAQQQRYHFFGEALDAAERLQQQCRPGDILVQPRVVTTAAAGADAASRAVAGGGFRFSPAAAAGDGASDGGGALLLVGSLDAEAEPGQHPADSDWCGEGCGIAGGGKGGGGGAAVGQQRRQLRLQATPGCGRATLLRRNAELRLKWPGLTVATGGDSKGLLKPFVAVP